MRSLEFPYRTDQFTNYIGGELEEVNPNKNYRGRGRITTISIERGNLVVALAWWFEAVDAAGRPSASLADKWIEKTFSDWRYAVATSRSRSEDTLVPIADISIDELDRLIVQSPYFDNVCVLYPAGGSQLSVYDMHWTPNGPFFRWANAQGK